ncbi:MAG: terminase [Candidatus Pacebacteria bacterium]|jgi:hypothetical protein|nr:terminase [Candidatus Paceibacterota bacterium]|tara:strand:+ start:186 stop:611 length:426 start_codon:yes stop_codon:yes gene_type:complete
MTKKIDKALGVWDGVDKALKELPSTSQEVMTPPPTYSEDMDDIQDDYEYQRKQFYNLVEKGSTAIDGILELAKEGEHPRGYEVAGNLIKQVAEVTEKLGDLQEKMKRLQDVPNTAPKNVTNALFVGSTTELQKMLKGKTDV